MGKYPNIPLDEALSRLDAMKRGEFLVGHTDVPPGTPDRWVVGLDYLFYLGAEGQPRIACHFVSDRTGIPPVILSACSYPADPLPPALLIAPTLWFRVVQHIGVPGLRTVQAGEHAEGVARAWAAALLAG